MLVFILFYGLDWVATVPPTVALCREYFGATGPVVFGWVFASHQIGAAVAATGAGLVRDQLGDYDAGLVRRRRPGHRGVAAEPDAAGRQAHQAAIGPAGPGIGLAFPPAAASAAPAAAGRHAGGRPSRRDEAATGMAGVR